MCMELYKMRTPYVSYVYVPCTVYANYTWLRRGTSTHQYPTADEVLLAVEGLKERGIEKKHRTYSAGFRIFEARNLQFNARKRT